jgi:membrane protein
MQAFNAAYDVEESRAAWKRYLLSVVYTVGLAALIILATGFMLIGPQVVAWLSQHLPIGQLFVTLWAWFRWPLAVLLLMLAVAIVYYVTPNVEQDFRFITPGSVLAVLIWVLASLGFTYYVSNFGNFGATYGSLGAVIVLLLYFFISSAVLLFGAEVNAVIEHHAPEGKDPGEKALKGKQ